MLCCNNMMLCHNNIGLFHHKRSLFDNKRTFLNRRSLLYAEKNSFFDFTLPSSRHLSQTPMYKGLEPRDPFQFSLPSPSRPGSLIFGGTKLHTTSHWSLTFNWHTPVRIKNKTVNQNGSLQLWSESQKMGGRKLKNGRVTGGKIILPPVPQTPCTSAFERGHGRKGG